MLQASIRSAGREQSVDIVISMDSARTYRPDGAKSSGDSTDWGNRLKSPREVLGVEADGTDHTLTGLPRSLGPS